MSLRRDIITTADGSKTIHLPDLQEHYHSIHGAIGEAYHVFIEMGLNVCRSSELHILEMGFGTGLNTLITCYESQRAGRSILFTSWEAYPVPPQEPEQLDYVTALDIPQFFESFKRMHSCPWEEPYEIIPGFILIKKHADIRVIEDRDLFDLIYYDAFSPRVQPELWTEAVFMKMYAALKNGGILVTYSAKGDVRRAMLSAGFNVERLPGPPGKREMLRARKIE